MVEHPDPSRPWRLLVLSARTPLELEEDTDRLVNYLEDHPDEELTDIAYTCQVHRPALEYRRMVVCHAIDDALEALRSKDPKRVLDRVVEWDRSVAFLLPGVGDHYVGMGWGLYRSVPSFREEVARCCGLLEPDLGIHLHDLLYPACSPSRMHSGSLSSGVG